MTVSERELHGEVVRQIDNLRVSERDARDDEDAASMMRVERTDETNARFFTTVSQTLDDLLNPGR